MDRKFNISNTDERWTVFFIFLGIAYEETKMNLLKKEIKRKMTRDTQVVISDKLGISQPYLSLILNGKRKPKNIKVILKKINLTLTNN